MPLTPAEELDRLLTECHILTNVQKIERARHYVSYLSEPMPAERVLEALLPHLTREFVPTSLVDGNLEDMSLEDIAERAKRHERLLKIIGSPKVTSEDPPASGSQGKESATCTICGKTGYNASRCWNRAKKSSGSTSRSSRANRVVSDGDRPSLIRVIATTSEGKRLPVILDCGAQISIMSNEVREELNIPIRGTEAGMLAGFNGALSIPIGEVEGHTTRKTRFVIVEGAAHTLLRLDAMRAFGVMFDSVSGSLSIDGEGFRGEVARTQ